MSPVTLIKNLSGRLNENSKSILLLTLLSIFGFQPRTYAIPKEVLGLCTDSLVQIPTVMLATGEIRQNLIAANDQILNLDNGNTPQTQRFSHWNRQAYNNYLLLGLKPSEIRDRIVHRLESALSVGRSVGLSDNIAAANPLWSRKDFALDEAPTDQVGFIKKYKLNEMSALISKLGQIDVYENGLFSYANGLGYGYELAGRVKDHQRQAELFLHMLKLKALSEAYRSAGKSGDGIALLIVANFALVEFFFSRQHLYSRANNVVEALKRVQGEFKPYANQLLYDFATEITSPSFIQKVYESGSSRFGASGTDERRAEIEEKMHNYALQALRSTGDLVKIYPIDSYDVDYRTQVNDPKVKAMILKLASKGPIGSPRLNEHLLSLQSINAVDELNAKADEEFSKRRNVAPHRVNFQFERALEYFEAAGNKESIRRVLKTWIQERGRSITGYIYSSKILPRSEADLSDEELALLDNAFQVKQSQDPENHGDWGMARSAIAKILHVRRTSHSNAESVWSELPDYIQRGLLEEGGLREHLNWIETQWHEAPELRENAQANGEAALQEGNTDGSAYTHFLEAQDPAGLMKAAKSFEARNDGLNAWASILASIVISQRQAQPD